MRDLGQRQFECDQQQRRGQPHHQHADRVRQLDEAMVDPAEGGGQDQQQGDQVEDGECHGQTAPRPAGAIVVGMRCRLLIKRGSGCAPSECEACFVVRCLLVPVAAKSCHPAAAFQVAVRQPGRVSRHDRGGRCREEWPGGGIEPGRTKSEDVGGAKRDRTADLLHAMQALSQLSYGPIRPALAGAVSGEIGAISRSAPSVLAASRPPPSAKIKPSDAAYLAAARRACAPAGAQPAQLSSSSSPTPMMSATSSSSSSSSSRKVSSSSSSPRSTSSSSSISGTSSRLGLFVGLLERDDLGALRPRPRLPSPRPLPLPRPSLSTAGLEIGARIGLARIGRHDRILVQIVEFLTRLRVDTLCAKFGFCHVQASFLKGRSP